MDLPFWYLLAGWRCCNLRWHSDVYQLYHLLESSLRGACLLCEPSWTLLPSPRWTDRSARLSHMTICCTRWADWSKSLLPEPSWTFLPSPRWNDGYALLTGRRRVHHEQRHRQLQQLRHLLKLSDSQLCECLLLRSHRCFAGGRRQSRFRHSYL